MTSFLAPELDWLAQGLLLSLALGLLLAVFVGVMMLIRPAALFEINQRWSRWVDTSSEFKMLDKPRAVDRWFYRYHRMTGILITLSAAYVLWEWMFAYERQGLFAALGERWASPALSWLISGGEWVVVLLHLLILVFGVVIAVRPSLLKRIEAESNQWHEPDLSKVMDRVFSPVERSLQSRPRLAGLVLLLTATWCLFGLLPLLHRMVT